MKLGEYEVTGQVGQGGMGYVLRGRGPDGADVAIKVLHRPDPDAVARFERERELLASLGLEQGFVPLLAAGASPQGPFLVMPFVPGGTLRERIDRGGRLSIDEVVAIGKALGGALGHAHARGIVHRDLKPENILFQSDGRPLVADLGIAKHFLPRVDPTGRASLSRSGELRGSPCTMAPEQVHDAKSVGPRADVYAAGATLYEALTGRPVVDGDTLVDVLSRIVAGRIERVRALRPDCPPWLAALVERCLATEPRERPRNGFALRQALERGGAVRGRSVLLAVAAVAAVVLGLAGAVAIGRPGASDAPPLASPTPRPAPPPPIVASAPAGEPAPAPEALPIAAPWRGVVPPAGARLVATAGRAAFLSMIACVDLSPDGASALATSIDGRLRVWDLATGRDRLDLEVGSGQCLNACFGRDGRAIAVTSDDGIVRLIDATTGAALRSFTGHTGRVHDVAFDRAGARLFSAGGDATVRIWDVASGRELAQLSCSSGVLCVALSPDEGTAVCGLTDGGVEVWDLRGVTRRALFEGHGAKAACAVAVLADGRRAVTGGADGKLRTWDLERLAPIDVLDGLEEDRALNHVRAIAVLDATRIVVGGDDALARVWDMTRNAPVARFAGHGSWVSGVALDVARGRMLTGGNDLSTLVWDLGDPATPPPRPWHEGAVGAIAERAGRVVSSDATGWLCAWDAPTGRALARMAGPGNPAGTLTLSPRGDQVLTLGDDAVLRGYSIAEPGPGHRVRAFTSDAKLVALADGSMAMVDGGRLSLDPPAPDQPRVLVAIEGRVQLVAPLGPGRAVVALADGALEAWDLAARARIERLPPGGIGVTGIVCLAGSSDGLHVLAGGSDLGLWDLERGVAGVLEGHAAQVRQVAFSADGRHAVSCSADATARLWRLPGEALGLIDLAPVPDAVTSVAFSLDAPAFLVGTARGGVLRFELLAR